jgi:dTDP-4-amino-4,6-dideoxygalactose transaminase
VTLANGSAALVCALQALGVGVGDEVLVPALTWPACTSAVIRCGAVPVLVDIDPLSLCMDFTVAESLVTSRTSAILAVHLYGAMLNPLLMRAFADSHHIAIVEDCSHVHGASWEGQYAGTFGDCGVFSFQQSKLMTSGEGGAVVTRCANIARRVEQLRADGRTYRQTSSLSTPAFALEEVGTALGANYCLSEFQAAILRAQLERLLEQNSSRQRASTNLYAGLSTIPGVAPQAIDPRTTPAYYAFVLRLERDKFGDRPVQIIADAVQAEIGFPVTTIYPSLSCSVLYQPQAISVPRMRPDYLRAIDPAKFNTNHADAASESCIAFHHRLLLAPPSAMDQVVAAVDKVRRRASELPAESN